MAFLLKAAEFRKPMRTGRAVNSHGLSSSSVDSAFTTPGPPIISIVATGTITTNAATILWITDQLSDSRVEYGTTTAYGSSLADPQ